MTDVLYAALEPYESEADKERREALERGEPLHHITSRDYLKAHNGDLWPQWHCRCGGSEYTITSMYTPIEEAQQECRKSGDAHVINSNKAEAMKAATNGKFSF